MTEKEFSEIIEATKPVVLSAIEKNLAERFFHAIDDVVQETYFRAYKSLSGGKFKEESKISTWLYTIAKNESLRMNEKLSREEKKHEKLKQNISEGNTEPTFSERIQSAKENFSSYIKLLPEKYSNIISLLVEGSSEEEIAEKLSIKKGTVKSRSFRARHALKQLILRDEK